MKKYIYTLTGILVSITATAQVQSRLVGQAQFDYNNNIFSLADTFTYQYSGGRGSNMKTGEYKYDTSVYALGSQLMERSIQTFYYPSQQLQESITQNYTAGQWENYRRQHYYYNTTGSTDSVLQEAWNPFNKIWMKDKRITYAYNGQGALTEYLEQTWDNLTAYGPYRRIQYVYNGNNLRKKTESFWDAGTSAWAGHEEHRYIYDLNGKIVSDSMELWDNMAAQWQHELRTIYTYAGGKLATLVEKDWDPVGMALVSDYKHIYAYNAQGLPEYDTLFAWDNSMSSYEKSRLYISLYDASGNLDTNEEQYLQNDTFRHYRLKAWTYNSYNQPLTYNIYLWDATGMAWEPLQGPDTRINYHYQEYDPAAVHEVYVPAGNGIRIFPNPASSLLTIDTKLPATIKIYSTTGMLLKQWHTGGQYPATVSVYDIAPGLYLVRIQTANKEMTKRLLIAR